MAPIAPTNPKAPPFTTECRLGKECDVIVTV
jgi:hypothetical protein